jgi:vitamin B12 transporter
VSGSTAYTVTERDNVGVFSQYLGRFGMHDLQASLRGDDNEQFGSQTTGSLAWGYEFGGGLRLTASYGTAFKAPTFNELYFPGFGNPSLRPEESSSIEAGISDTTTWGNWSVNLYQTDIDDLIAFDANTFAPANIDSARIRGLEAVLDARFGQWDLSTSLTLLDPINKGDGPNRDNLLPRRAEQSLRLDLDRSFGHYSLGATLLGVGRRYDDIANNRELDAYVTLDLRGEYRLAQAWRLQARIDNLFDEEYETAAFYNQPGRSFFLTLRYQP